MTKTAARAGVLACAFLAWTGSFWVCDAASAAVGGGGARAGAAAGARAGNFSRSGVAANGGLASGAADRGAGPTIERARSPEDRAAAVSAIEANRSKNVKIEGGADCRGDCWDNGEAAAKIAVGAAVAQAISAAHTQAVLPCNAPPLSVGGAPYYRCGDIWYTPGYGPEGVVYMPVQPPPQ
jgi:hypothetical protein